MKDPIVQTGAAVLRERAKPIGKKDFGSRKLLSLIEKMREILAEEEFGVALAAPQVGTSLRLFVVAPRAYRDDEEQSSEEEVRHTVFINPELIRVSRRKREMSEGCLSVRGKYGTVMRHERATVRAYDENGKRFTLHASGLIAHIFQHEIDHLDGVLYIDKAEKLVDDEQRHELREQFPAGDTEEA